MMPTESLPDQLHAAQVPVKPLAFAPFPMKGWKIGAYVAPDWPMIVRTDTGWNYSGDVFKTAEDALSAANADHAARIRAALAPDPVRDAMIEAVAALEMYQRGYAEQSDLIVTAFYAGETALAKLTAALETK